MVYLNNNMSIMQELLVNATRAVGALARDNEARLEMERLDAFRLVWSLLKHPSTFVQSSAAWAICPYVRSSMVSIFYLSIESLSI